MRTIKNMSPTTFAKILPTIAFVIPLAILYSLYPASFEATWKGRTYYIFFIWILLLETALNWEALRPKSPRLKSLRTAVLFVMLALPTIYIVVANYTPLNSMIVDASPKFGSNRDAYWAKLMPLTVEYLAFAVALALMLIVMYGLRGMRDLPLSLCLVSIVGLVYLADNLYPYGEFTPFQVFVPITMVLASSVLNFMGYRTMMIMDRTMPVLRVTSPAGVSWQAQVGWPCSGVESLLIYTVIILLFLKRMPISFKLKTAYFIIGAAVTYFINALRIATIFVMAVNSGDWGRFHDYYGQLYSITWIVFYPLIILGSQGLWMKIQSWRTSRRTSTDLTTPKGTPTSPPASP